MILGTLTKQPGDSLDYDIDYSDWLTSDDNVSSATTAVSPDVVGGVTVDLININDPRVKLWISGGVSGVTYKITITMETSDGRIKEDEFRLRVKET
jgi:hypothetical protein